MYNITGCACDLLCIQWSHTTLNDIPDPGQNGHTPKRPHSKRSQHFWLQKRPQPKRPHCIGQNGHTGRITTKTAKLHLVKTATKGGSLPKRPHCIWSKRPHRKDHYQNGHTAFGQNGHTGTSLPPHLSNGRNTNHYQNGHIIDPLPGISHARGCACSHTKIVYVAIYFLAITSLCRVLHMLQLRNYCVVLKDITLLDPLEFRWEQMKFPSNLNSGWNGPQVSTLLDPLEFRWEQNEISIEFEFRGKYL